MRSKLIWLYLNLFFLITKTKTNLIKLNIKLIQKSNNEIIWSLDRKTNEKLFE